MTPRRLLAVTVKELRQLRRDRVTLAMVVMIPVMQLLLFGYGINTNLRALPAGIADEAGTAGSRALVMDLLATGVVRAGTEAGTPQQLMDALRSGDIAVGIAIPPDFERRRIEGRTVAQILVDGSDNAVQWAAAQLAQLPVEVDAAAVSRHPHASSRGGEPAISVVGFYNPQRRSALNVVPGLIGVILTMTMILFTGVSIVRERERGNMELLIATPISSAELMIGKITPYVVIGLLQTSVVLVLGMWLFDVAVAGSLWEVYVAASLLILANLTLGLLISTRARSQFQAMQMTFFLFLPSILLSGFMFPFAGMPPAVQWFAELLPLTHFVRLIRGIVLRGAGLADMWPDVLALVAFTLVMMSAAVAQFRKRLD
ncbi:ABC transporter permease [Luteimonas deserti]|uniref:Transport permease protein n=1 Tax=Luteimonas deserti TaxID=2752306 RepID=A0A7Z0QMF9_9GAMM|nr:ABC transporter permease [Luteimonas deserti]NYZ61346.1 ABC transporter permease [Luteimonas deserti]